MNARLAREAIAALARQGVTEYCICPGARNAPLIAALGRNESWLKSYYFYDERSAAFFALGRIRATRHPVAVVTTSGTAAGELLAAAMEAHYSGLPLVLVTADRPRRYRESGAPQAAEQVGIFGRYAHAELDIAEAETWPARLVWDRQGTLHANLCFEEPLLESATDGSDPYVISPIPEDAVRSPRPMPGARVTELAPEATRLVSGLRHPLLIVAGLAPSERPAVRAFLRNWGAPVYFEALSGLREDATLAELRIQSGEKIFARASECGYAVDGVLRIGGIPTLRAWRDLESDPRYADLSVLSLSALPFSGLGRPSLCVAGNLEESLGALREHLPRVARGREAFAAFQRADEARADALSRLLDEEPRSEPAFFRALSERMPAPANVYLGNSLPIREWDLAATFAARDFEISASRGLNGIDGQVSTFLGGSRAGEENWGIFGDLTALYDLSGPWALSQLAATRAQIVVVNNGGGRIFDRMFADPRFQNQHRLEFGPWAQLWGLPYARAEDVPVNLLGRGTAAARENGAASPAAGFTRAEGRILELVPDQAATDRFWTRYAKL